MIASRGPRRGRPAQLSREAIVAAALDSDIDALTMRQLAARLGVAHSALYRWVRDRDEVLDLVADTVIDRVLPDEPPTGDTWRDWLTQLAWAMHDQFVATPRYAARLTRPHRHIDAAGRRLRDAATAAFGLAGAPPALAEQSWHVFSAGIIGWLAISQQPDGEAPRFDVLLDTLLRALPAQDPSRT